MNQATIPQTDWGKYHTPESCAEAIELLAKYNGEAVIVGGGTDLLLDINQGRRPHPIALIDVTQITGLAEITAADGNFIIGAGVTHTQIVRDPQIKQNAQCLHESCGVIGGPQVRNVGTLAGNIAHALPAGDGTIGSMTLGGDIKIVSAAGSRWMPLQDNYIGPGKSAIDPTLEFISHIRLRATTANEGSAFHRIMRPQGVALPIIGMAARIALEGQEVKDAQIIIGPAGPVPFVAQEATSFLLNKPATEENLQQATAIVDGEVSLRDSRYRASAKYRQQMIKTFLPIVLARASQRANATNT